MSDAVNRAIDLSEEYDTMMEVQRNPCGAWMAIQEMAGIIAALPAVQPDAREAALREVAKVLADRADYLEDAVKWGGSKQYLASLKGGAIELRHARNSILALINKPAEPHVNETPKSEHVPGVMLMPATKGGE